MPLVPTLGEKKPSESESTLRTFRVDSRIIDLLEIEAKKQGTTINGLACNVLEKYVTIRAKLDHFGLICLTKDEMVAIVNRMDDPFIIEIASKIGGTTAKEIVLRLYGKATPQSFRTYVDEVLCGYQCWASYSGETIDGKIEIRLGHTMGLKWALFLSNYLDSALDSITGKRANFSCVSNYNIIFTIDLTDTKPTAGSLLAAFSTMGQK